MKCRLDSPLFAKIVSPLLAWMLASMVTLTASFAQEINAPQEKRVALRVEKNIPFSEVDGQQVCADLYRPDSSKVLPIVVMIHGGAWVAGDKWNVADHAREMARAGFVVMAINYRLAPVHLYPAHLDDCKAALRWIAKHHAEWNGDIDRLGVWGYSAGAHLAALLAFGPIDNLPRPIACVAGGIPSDLRKIPENSRLLSPVFGGTRAEKPKVYEEASPIRFVENNSPPCFLFHGTDDQIVPFEHSQALLECLRQKNVACDLFEAKDQGHLVTFMNLEARSKAIDFLKQHLLPRK